LDKVNITIFDAFISDSMIDHDLLDSDWYYEVGGTGSDWIGEPEFILVFKHMCVEDIEELGGHPFAITVYHLPRQSESCKRSLTPDCNVVNLPNILLGPTQNQQFYSLYAH